MLRQDAISGSDLGETNVDGVSCRHLAFVEKNGVFYESTSNGYKITDPPPGVMVTSLPNGAALVMVNGVDYREFGGVWYQPFYSGSEVIYQTVPNPTA